MPMMSQIDDLPVTSTEIRSETRKDKVLATVLNQAMNGWENTDIQTIKPYYNRRNEITVSHGCLLWGISYYSSKIQDPNPGTVTQ